MKNSHLFILPSIEAKDGDKEGIPVVLMEAMATGIPVISTYHSGIPELIEDDKTGYLVKEKNIEELYKKMLQVIENYDSMNKITHNARKKIEKDFNLIKQTNKLEKIYYHLIENQPSFIDIIMSCDKKHNVGLFKVVNSIISNTNNPTSIFFHFTIEENETQTFKKMFKEETAGLGSLFRYEIVEFKPTKFLKENIRILNEQEDKNIYNHMNFARFYFCDIYPNLEKVIYLDTDVIVNSDIHDLWNNTKLDKYFFAARQQTSDYTKNEKRDFKFYMYDFNDFSFIDKNEIIFNAGIFVTNLKKWKEHKITKKLENIMLKQKKSKKGIYKSGTQIPLNIVFYNQYEKIAPEWNMLDLGNYDKLNIQILKEKGKILHWNGPNKPWKKNGYYKNLWET